MEQHLIDTNIVSNYFSASFSANGMAIMDEIINAMPNISIITQLELLCWNTDDTTAQYVIDFINDSVVLNIDSDVVSNAVVLRKSRRLKHQMPLLLLPP